MIGTMTKDAKFQLRVDEADLERWRAAAEAEGRSLANWISYVCNARLHDAGGAKAPSKTAKAKRGGKS